jgi:hypothetical protein
MAYLTHTPEGEQRTHYFRVRAGDGNVYILRHDQEQDRWRLDAFRRK